MPQLILVRSPQVETFEYHPDVTLATLKYDCKVYCFVFGKSDLYNELKSDLQALGEEYEKNIYVGFWKMGDPNFDIVAEEYKLMQPPSIVITAFDELSYAENDEFSFIRIEGRLLREEYFAETKQLIRELYTLYIRKDIREAVIAARNKKIKVAVDALVKKFGRFSEKFLRLLGQIGLSVEYGGAKLTLGRDEQK
jgi:hypothetical protein